MQNVSFISVFSALNAFGCLLNLIPGHVGKGVDKVLEIATERMHEGQLPANHDLQRAFRTSVGKATRVLTYHLYNPDGPSNLLDLLEHLKDWPKFSLRLNEIANNNLVPTGEPSSTAWLAWLNEMSQTDEALKKIPLDVFVADHQITQLTANEVDEGFKRHLHASFLKWVTMLERRKRLDPEMEHWESLKPVNFKKSVEDGIYLGHPKGKKELFCFYDIFRLFFREELKGDTRVFRAFAIDVQTGLAESINEIKERLPQSDEIRELTEALKRIRSVTQSDQTLNETWIRHLDEQNASQFDWLQKEITDLREDVAAVGRTVTDIDGKADDILGQVKEIRGAVSSGGGRTAWFAGLAILLLAGGICYWKFHGEFQQVTGEQTKELTAVARNVQGTEQTVQRTGEQLLEGQKVQAERVINALAEKMESGSALTNVPEITTPAGVATIFDAWGLRALGQTPLAPGKVNSEIKQLLLNMPGREVVRIINPENLASNLVTEMRPFQEPVKGKSHRCSLLDEDLVWVPAGQFQMGSLPGEKGGVAAERPVTTVTISRGFWMAAHEVTEAELALFVSRPMVKANAQLAAEGVTWDEGMKFCRELTKFERENRRLAPDWEYSLPTEAEWELACRSGTTTRFNTGDDEESAGEGIWQLENSERGVHPVGQKKPNAWGLYDMEGNVSEWCLDWFGAHPGGTVTDPTGPRTGELRVARGGNWSQLITSCRSASRAGLEPGDSLAGVGFRIALKQTIQQH